MVMINPELKSDFFKFIQTCEICISNIRDPFIKELALVEYSKLNNTLFFLSKKYGYLFPISKFVVSNNTTVLLHPYTIEDVCYSLFFIILYEIEDDHEEDLKNLKILENFVFYILSRSSILVPNPKTKTKYYSNQISKFFFNNISKKYKYKTTEFSRFNE